MKPVFLSACLAFLFCAGSFSAKAQSSASFVPAYFAMKDAMVAGDPAAVTQTAGLLATSIEKTPDSLLGATQKKSLGALAKKIAAEKTIDAQRKSLDPLSRELFAAIKSAPVPDQPVYEFYCPMKKAYWLSGETAVRNPYYGNGMLDCGNLVGTVK